MTADKVADSGKAPERITPPWETLVQVCTKCKGARRGPTPRDIRKGFKHRAGKKQMRVLESECMGVCPDDAITVCVSRAVSNSVSVYLVRSDAELDALADSLASSLNPA